MPEIEGIERRVAGVQHGFKEMREIASTIIRTSSQAESLQVAKRLFSSQRHQVRMVAVFVLGYTAVRSPEAFKLLRTRVSRDESWQVQEILAQAFNEYCRNLGYENAIPDIKDWLADGNPNVRRAVTEGLRIWNQRDYFRDHPGVAVGLLAGLKDDKSEYVRRSVGNALRDISRKEKRLIGNELSTWDTSDSKVRMTYELASKFL